MIDVRDTGIGIKEEDLGNLFTKFGRVDLVQTNTIEGTGLGLAITENLLLMMQGDIKVQSVYGEGSTFSVRIPQGVVSEEAIGDFHRRYEDGLKAMKAYHESFRAPDAHVLVVDDTELNLVVIEGLLKTTEVRLDTAAGGEEALALCKKTAYDLILLDQRMPRMNGTETLQHIRTQENGRNRETPVICLTADAVQGARERYLAEGFSGYLSKPVEGPALESALMEYLPSEKILRTAEGDSSAQIAAPHPDDSGSAPTGAERRQVAAPQALTDDYTGRVSMNTPASHDEHGCEECRNVMEVSSVQAAYDGIPALDYAQAKEYLTSDELIEKTLSTFYDNLRDTTDAIERSLREEDYDNFTIRVHALKSSARLIGAAEISALAARLEECGDAVR
ncbi:MAG: response regulator [Lachnospiraceae bacterium]|nr:response regulator [Lachnospiraceae bacterium]